MDNGLIALLIIIIPLLATWGWPMLPDIFQIVCRILTIVGIIVLFVLLLKQRQENKTIKTDRDNVKADRDKWKHIASGTVISKTDELVGDGSGPITRITKEVKKL